MVKVADHDINAGNISQKRWYLH